MRYVDVEALDLGVNVSGDLHVFNIRTCFCVSLLLSRRQYIALNGSILNRYTPMTSTPSFNASSHGHTGNIPGEQV